MFSFRHLAAGSTIAIAGLLLLACESPPRSNSVEPDPVHVPVKVLPIVPSPPESPVRFCTSLLRYPANDGPEGRPTRLLYLGPVDVPFLDSRYAYSLVEYYPRGYVSMGGENWMLCALDRANGLVGFVETLEQLGRFVVDFDTFVAWMQERGVDQMFADYDFTVLAPATTETRRAVMVAQREYAADGWDQVLPISRTVNAIGTLGYLLLRQSPRGVQIERTVTIWRPTDHERDQWQALPDHFSPVFAFPNLDTVNGERIRYRPRELAEWLLGQ